MNPGQPPSRVERLVLRSAIGIAVNAYLIVDGGECYVVDPGGDAEAVRRAVAGRGLTVRAILLTHAHIDHIGALDAFPVPIRLHPDELPLLRDRFAHGGGLFGVALRFDPAALDVRPLAPGESLPLGTDPAAVAYLPTPGHTAGGVCYRIGDDLLTGDTLFQGSVGRTDLPTGDAEALRASVLRLVRELPGGTRIHPGHGDPSTLADERRGNPFVRAWASTPGV